MSDRVYIVEDHAVMRDMLGQFLAEVNDMDVIGSAESGAAALEDLESLDPAPDLMLIDVSLPGMDGIEILRAIRSDYEDILCLMLSGHAEESYVRQAQEAGARGYVIKGHPSAILKAVRTVLGGGTFLSEDIKEHWPS